MAARKAIYLTSALLLLGCNKPEKIASRDAEEIFAKHCSQCHGLDGSGLPEKVKQLGVRDLGDRTWQATITDQQIGASIRRGKKNMPAWGPVLDDVQVEALVAKVRSLQRE